MNVRPAYSRWQQRHRSRLNFAMHLLGIPLTVAALPALLFFSFSLAAILFAAGYGLQFLGHLIEGNKSGEQLLIERILGRGSR